MRSLPLILAFLGSATLAAPIPSGLLGTKNSLAGSDFCRQYGCRAMGTQALQPVGGRPFLYALKVSGVRVAVGRAAEKPNATPQDDARGIVASGLIEVDTTVGAARAKAGAIARDFVRLLGGSEQYRELYDHCVSKASPGDFNPPRGTEDLIVLTQKVAVKCYYGEPGKRLIFNVFPPSPALSPAP